jgi:hypothetical protein
MKNKRSPRKGLPYWEGHVKAYQKSGLTQREYCRQNNISYWSFNPWKRKLESESSELCEIPIQTVQSLSSETKHIEIIISEKLKVTIPESFSKSTLRDVLSVLEVL